MEYEMKRLLERIPKEKHVFALQTLTIIASIKDECKASRRCEDCRFYDERNKNWNPCYFCGEDTNPSEWDEYDLTERIYK